MLPVITRLKAPLATLNAPVVVTSSTNLTVLPVVEAVTVTLSAVTLPLNVAPPELVTVTLSISVPMAPFTATAPVLLKATFDLAPPDTPPIAPVVIDEALPAPSVSVLPSLIVTFAKVMAPLDVPPMMAVSVTVAVPPLRLITPMPWALIVPAMLRLVGAVAITPPVNAVLSVESSPICRLPTLLNVVVPAMVLFDPLKRTL